MNRLRADHLENIKALARLNGCNNWKDTGDGLMAWFSESQQVVLFSVGVQLMDAPRVGLTRESLGVKIGIEHGEVELQGDDDIKGHAANVAARIQAQAEAGEVLLGPGLKAALASYLGSEQISTVLEPLGVRMLKGLGEVSIERLRWQAYDTARHVAGQLLIEGIKRAGLFRHSVEKENISGSGYLLWPVVPRSAVTAIHKAQLEVIALVSRYSDRKPVLLVADCGAFEISAKEARKFGKLVQTEAPRFGVALSEVELLSDWFAAEGEDAQLLRTEFQALSRHLDVQTLISFQEKNYRPEEREKYMADKVIDFLRPVLTGAAVIHFAKRKAPTSVLLLAGQDEFGQWDKVRSLADESSPFGIVFNSILVSRDGYVYKQKSELPLWGNEEHCLSEAENSNLLRWLTQHFLELPSFPKQPVVAGQELKFQDWSSNSYEPPGGHKPQAIVAAVWEKIRRH